MRRLVADAVLPLAISCAVALLVRGYEGIGDGFSAAVLAAALALLQYFSKSTSGARRATVARGAAWSLRVGLLVVTTVCWMPLLWGDALVTHYPQAGEKLHHVAALPVHTAFVFDMGVAMSVYGGVLLTFDRVFPDWSEKGTR